jgi:polyisoprenoid-binding protein YceI
MAEGHQVMRRVLVGALMAIVVFPSIDVPTATHTYRVDPAASRVTIHVGKAGAFSFVAGHTHEVIGPVQDGSVDVDLDTPSRSHVRLVIATPALSVSPAGEPEGDAPKVQDAMMSEKVLDAAHHPQVTFDSTGVTLNSRRGTMLDLVVIGQLTIRDVSRLVTVPVLADVSDGALTATGRFSIKQSAFGIKPISVGGVVTVKDTLGIDFSISAKP